MPAKDYMLQAINLPRHTERKLGKTILYVWVNPPANAARHLREMKALIDAANELLSTGYKKPGYTELLASFEEYQSVFLKSLSCVLSQGPTSTHWTPEELGQLADVIGDQAAEQLLNDVLAAVFDNEDWEPQEPSAIMAPTVPEDELVTIEPMMQEEPAIIPVLPAQQPPTLEKKGFYWYVRAFLKKFYR